MYLDFTVLHPLKARIRYYWYLHAVIVLIIESALRVRGRNAEMRKDINPNSKRPTLNTRPKCRYVDWLEIMLCSLWSPSQYHYVEQV
jgi:hypothetical protein